MMVTVPSEAALLSGLAAYTHGLRYDDLPTEVVHAAKARLIDTLAAMLGGCEAEPARMASGLARSAKGARVIGSGFFTTPWDAAFCNAISARCVDTLDAYHRHGKQGHPADCIAPVLTMADHLGSSGRDVITAVVLAYEVFCWLRDSFESEGFDNTNCARVASAAAAARLLGLDAEATGRCLALVLVQDNVLKEVRSRPAMMTRNTASGYGARAAVFSALMAKAGAIGPQDVLDAADGWQRRVAGGEYDIRDIAGRWRTLDTWLKLRAIPGAAYPLVIAAEKLAPLTDIDRVSRIDVAVYGKLFKGFGQGDKRWHPTSPDTADHSAPYIVATILTTGALTLRSFEPEAYNAAATRELMARISVAEDPDMTRAYRDRHEHRARVVVHHKDGSRQVAEAGGDAEDFSAPKSDAQVDTKFRWLAGAGLGGRTDGVLARWWRLETEQDLRPLLAALDLDDAQGPDTGRSDFITRVR